jgi:PleD family two-component response regulator
MRMPDGLFLNVSLDCIFKPFGCGGVMARILLVDDEQGILNTLSILLKSEGYETVAALGGEKRSLTS